jgi:hypothetical protein
MLCEVNNSVCGFGGKFKIKDERRPHHPPHSMSGQYAECFREDPPKQCELLQPTDLAHCLQQGIALGCTNRQMILPHSADNIGTRN